MLFLRARKNVDMPMVASAHLKGEMMFAYKDSYALVTGASKGLGKAYAQCLAGRGTNLVLTARSGPVMEMLAEKLRAKHKIRVEVLEADLGDPATPPHILRNLEERGIEIDLLINNAGFGLSGSFLSHPLDQELAQVQLNVQGLLMLTYLFGQRMAKRGRGGIINVASNSSFQPVPYMATYGATKAFILMFSEAIAEELKNKGVRVMVACPGPTATHFFEQAPTTVPAHDMDSAEFVARRTLEAFDSGKVVAYPGRTSVRVFSWGARILPRSITAKIAAGFAKRMGFMN